MQLIQSHIKELQELCSRYFVNRLYVFGSVSTDTVKDSSDVDLLVDFKDVTLEKYADNYFDLKFSLESLFSRPVDLLEEKELSNPYLKKSIDRTKKLIYG